MKWSDEEIKMVIAHAHDPNLKKLLDYRSAYAIGHKLIRLGIRRRNASQKDKLYRICRTCNKRKNINEFYANVACVNGRTTICKFCDNNRRLKQKKTAKGRKATSEYTKRKRLTSIEFKLAATIRTRLSNVLIRNKKPGSSIRHLGCTLFELKKHLESLFQDGMTWENHGRMGWHIDHIKPLSKFQLSDLKQFKEACHYTNLQPLWYDDNIRKGNKTID